jgi:hypothetical protein
MTALSIEQIGFTFAMRWASTGDKDNFVQPELIASTLSDEQVSEMDGIESAAEEAQAPQHFAPSAILRAGSATIPKIKALPKRQEQIGVSH